MQARRYRAINRRDPSRLEHRGQGAPITRQVTAGPVAYRPGNRQDTRRQAPWRHDHRTGHIHASGAALRPRRPSPSPPRASASPPRTSASKRMGGASRRSRRHVHGRAGLLHRQRRAALDAARPARQRGRDRMGRGRLCADLGRVPDRRRAPRRPDRPAPDVLAGPRPVHAVLGDVRRRRQPGDAGRRAAGAGHRRGADDAQRPGDHRRHLPRPRAWRARSASMAW